MSGHLHARDFEILRTLARLRFLTTEEIIAAFFATSSAARRRLRKLVDMDLIAEHSKGLPAFDAARAWRLTRAGVAALVDVFPDEPLPDALADRLPDTSLTNFVARWGINVLYLAFLTYGQPVAADAHPAALKQRMTSLRKRASQIMWRPAGDVIFRSKVDGQPQQFIPHATVIGQTNPLVVFVEIDRPGQRLRRVAETLRRCNATLRSAARTAYPSKEPCFLYIVRSEMRRDEVSKLAEKILAGLAWYVILDDAAVDWLNQAFLCEEARADVPTRAEGVSRPASHPELTRLCLVARELYVAYRSHLRTCKAHFLPQHVTAFQGIRTELNRVLSMVE